MEPERQLGQNQSRRPKFVVATPQRSVCDDLARVLEREGLLRFIALGTRRGTAGIPPERTRLNPWIGLWTYAAERAFGTFRGESIRFRLLPWFDRWVLKQLTPGDHLISSYGYVNNCFQFARHNGGKTFVEAGNSHIEQFWELLSDEQRRWNSPYPPVSRFWFERSRAMLAKADYVLSPSSYVTQSFLSRGFQPERILRNVYPVNLSLFQPATEPRPAKRPLTVINTGSLSLRKGTPYLVEAFRLVLRQEPSARLLLTRNVRDEVRAVLESHRDLPIDWAPPQPHAALAERLRAADIFVLPSLEEGLARSALEALSCGLQAVLTPHTGANDFILPGQNGEVVPIRDPQATATAIFKCWERAGGGARPPVLDLQQRLSFERFARDFIEQLDALDLL